MTEPVEPGEHGEFPLKDFLGMDIEAVAPGHARARIEVGGPHMNPNGVAHGAVIFAMVDTSMGKAAMSVLDEGQFCATTDVHLRFLRPVRPGPIVADTRVVRKGRVLVQLETRVSDAEDRLLATGTGAFAVITP
jgi:acyl-CoA thioesterase